MKKLAILVAAFIVMTSLKSEHKYPCHPLGDLGPCQHWAHTMGDLYPCQHTFVDNWGNVRILHPAGDLGPCTHWAHSAGDLYPCTHVCF